MIQIDRLISHSLRQHPEDWQFDSHINPASFRPYYLHHRPTGSRLWIASGRGFYKLGGRKSKPSSNGGRPIPRANRDWPAIGFFGQFRVHSAVEAWLRDHRTAIEASFEVNPADFGVMAEKRQS